MTKQDRTFHVESRFGSMLWCATALGMTLDAFRKSRPALERHSGFPVEDPLLGATLKESVDDWIRARKRGNVKIPNELEPRDGEIRLDRL